MQRQMGGDAPDFCHLLDGMFWPEFASVSLRHFIQPRVEPEIAFVLERRLEGPGITLADAARAVGFVLPAIGIIDSRIRDWKISLADTIADNAGRLCREEIFGRLVTVVPFEDENDAVSRANDTRYGLNAMIFTSELSRAHRVAARLRAGTVWVNCFFVRDLRAPFGGVGDSGVGRGDGNFSRDFFTEPKAVVMQIAPAP